MPFHVRADVQPDPARGSPMLFLIDVQMMAMLGEARERSEVEFIDMLSESGFAFQQLIPTASQVSIVESVIA
jgi:hypothetical protein